MGLLLEMYTHYFSVLIACTYTQVLLDYVVRKLDLQRRMLLASSASVEGMQPGKKRILKPQLLHLRRQSVANFELLDCLHLCIDLFHQLLQKPEVQAINSCRRPREFIASY
jgi:hypothetical protein